MTKNGYLLMQVVLLVGAVALMLGLRPVFAAPGAPFNFVDDHFWTIIAVLLALEGLETAAMLWKFRKAENDRLAGIRHEGRCSGHVLRDDRCDSQSGLHFADRPCHDGGRR